MNTPADVLEAVAGLSVLVITCPGKWTKNEFLPSSLSRRKIDWFEGTGAVIGIKRSRVFILSSIHCIPEANYTYFIKGAITDQKQVIATLCCNHFIRENNGIDVAIFSCDVKCFKADVQLKLSCVRWCDNFSIGSSIWLVHFPTSSEEVVATHRLTEDVHPSTATGNIVSIDTVSSTFDSTIVATGGSSGGILVDASGFALGVHDSQHDDTEDGTFVSTHRTVSALRDVLSSVRQLEGMFT